MKSEVLGEYAKIRSTYNTLSNDELKRIVFVWFLQSFSYNVPISGKILKNRYLKFYLYHILEGFMGYQDE